MSLHQLADLTVHMQGIGDSSNFIDLLLRLIELLVDVIYSRVPSLYHVIDVISFIYWVQTPAPDVLTKQSQRPFDTDFVPIFEILDFGNVFLSVISEDIEYGVGN